MCGTRLCLVVLSLIALSTAPAPSESRSVAITVDDLPVAGSDDPAAADRINDALIKSFGRYGVPATGFVIEQRVQRIGEHHGRRILENWVRHGHDLGNHTFSHHDLNKLTPGEFMEDVIRGEKTYRRLLPKRDDSAHFLRFPFNHTGDTASKRDAVQALLAERGYTVAVCTIDSSDYEFERAYAAALANRDESSAGRIREEYLLHSAKVIDYYSRLHREIFGRETSHVMLLHANRLNADVIGRLMGLFVEKAFRFVTLAEAQSDPAYATPEGPPTRFGPMWAYRWARQKGIRINGSLEPETPAWIREYGR